MTSEVVEASARVFLQQYEKAQQSARSLTDFRELEEYDRCIFVTAHVSRLAAAEIYRRRMTELGDPADVIVSNVKELIRSDSEIGNSILETLLQDSEVGEQILEALEQELLEGDLRLREVTPALRG